MKLSLQLVALAGSLLASMGADACGPCRPYPLMLSAVVRDSITGAPLADSALGIVEFESVQDTMRGPQPGSSDSLHLLYRPPGPGTYTLTVTRPGYADWSGSVVIPVPNGDCANTETFVLVRLQPLQTVPAAPMKPSAARHRHMGIP